MNRKLRLTSQTALLGATLLIALSLASFSALSRNDGVAHPGDLDPTFGTGGKVVTSLSAVNGNDAVQAAAKQTDGKLVVAGSSYNRVTGDDYSLARYNVDGSLDASFGIGGKVITTINSIRNETIRDIAIQSDGKIVVVGSEGEGQAFYTVRYNADGSLDNSFGNGGRVFSIPTNGGGCRAYAVALQGDGKIVVAGAGWVNMGQYVSTNFALVRHNSNGSLDMSFGINGAVVTKIGNGNESYAYPQAVAIQSDGKIVAAGYVNAFYPEFHDFALARYNTDGTLDTTFGTGGKVITAQGESCKSIALQSDGKIVAAGSPSFSLARYNVDGTLDATFGNGGFVTTQIGQENSSAYDVALQTDGKIVAAGSTSYISSNSKFAVARYNPDGALDMSFGSGGQVITPIGDSNFAHAAIVQNDGKIVVAGYSSDGQDTDFALARYDAGGALDLNYGSNGIVITQIAGNYNTYDYGQAVALQSDGKIVVAGYAAPYPAFALARYNDDGTLDSSFGSGGKVVTRFGRDQCAAYAATIQNDGKIILAGSNYNNSGSYYDFALVRYNTDGTLDTNFGIGGRVVTGFSEDRDFAHAVVLQSDGKIIAVGESARSFALARYNMDGSLDASFGAGGKVVTTFGGDAHAFAVELQDDGRIIAAGDSTGAFTLTRYNTDGSLDLSFGNGGRVITPGAGAHEANAIALQNDGRIVVAGSAFPPGFTLARYTINGVLDPTFGVDGFVRTQIYEGMANSIAIQSDGKIIAAGSGGLSDYANFTVARYSSGGVLDQGFGNAGIVVSPISSNREDIATAVALQSDGKLIAAGRNFNGLDYDFALARYHGGTSSVPVSRRAFDFDGDGKADLSVFRPSDAVWYIQSSSTNNLSAQIFGRSTDKLVPSDYDGDGKTDVAVFRDGMWYGLNSSDNTFVAVHFGQAGDIPVPGDYDGDYEADRAVYRNGIWYIMQSSAGFTAVQFGNSTDKPVAADYDGDGKVDPAVYRDGIWYLLQSALGFSYEQFGIATDRPVVSDYDGDGRADLAVYRSGTWYVRPTSSNIFFVLFGSDTGTPVPADYDGDGRADLATFRNGSWYIRRSTNLSFTTQQFGTGGDVAVPSAYVPL